MNSLATEWLTINECVQRMVEIFRWQMTQYKYSISHLSFVFACRQWNQMKPNETDKVTLVDLVVLWSPAKWWIKIVLFIDGPVTSCSFSWFSLSPILTFGLLYWFRARWNVFRISSVDRWAPRVCSYNSYANDLWLCEHKCCAFNENCTSERKPQDTSPICKTGINIYCVYATI